jgi:RNA polymerase sigma-70 factor (ECF subfamily)
MSNYRELTENFLQSRSDEDFAKLFYRIKPGLTSYVYKIVKDRDVAEDITINSLTKMWTKIEQFDPSYQITTWVYRIAFNESLGWINRRNKKTSLDYLSDFGVEITTAGSLPNELDDLIQEHEQKSEQDYLEEDAQLMETYENALTAMKDLKSMYRDIIVDRLINNMKYDDIANKHNISLQTVKNRIRRGKSLIASQIA